MTTLDQTILTAILADFDRLRAIDPRTIDRRNATSLFMRVDDAHKYRLVPLAVASWVGDSSQAGIRAGQRGIARLEDTGHLVRDARWGMRATHVELTEAGEAAARALEAKP